MADKDFYDIKGLGELPTEETTSKSSSSYRSNRSTKKSTHLVRNILIGVVVIIIVLALSGGGYYYLKHHKSSVVVKPSPSTTTTPAAPAATATPASTTLHYISNGKDLNLEFDYPANWTVSPATGGNASDQAITVDSPAVTIPDATNASTSGKVTITLRPGSAQLSELTSGTPTGAQDSIQIAYAHPSAAQHQYTYLTFIHFTTGSNAAGAFEQVMVTGIQQFKKGDPVTATALASLDPIIAVNFYRCGSNDCAAKGSGSLSVTNATWQNNAFVVQAQAIIKSLKLK